MKIQPEKPKSGVWGAILNAHRQLVRALQTESAGSHVRAHGPPCRWLPPRDSVFVFEHVCGLLRPPLLTRSWQAPSSRRKMEKIGREQALFGVPQTVSPFHLTVSVLPGASFGWFCPGLKPRPTRRRPPTSVPPTKAPRGPSSGQPLSP